MREHAGICLLLLMTGATIANSDVISLEFHYEQPSVMRTDLGYEVHLEDCRTIAHVGEPLLPVCGGTVLLPPGHEITRIAVEIGDPVLLQGSYELSVAQPQYPLSYSGPWEKAELKETLEGSMKPFPPALVDKPKSHFLAGYGLGSFLIHPVQYIPATGSVLYFPSLMVRISTAPTATASHALETLYRGCGTDRTRLDQTLCATHSLSRGTDRLLSSYPPLRSTRSVYDILLITNESLLPEFDTYVAYKTTRGWRVLTTTVETIHSTYAGSDEQEKIRNCISDIFTTCGIEYVLLGGDDEIIPHRGLHADPGGGYGDADIAADLYYAALDGNWNADGDSLWGEPGEADLVAEVSIGRACVDSPAEVAAFTNKTISYQDSPLAAECTKALMVGELLWNDPTWGGDYKDEIIYGAWTYGDETAGFPPSFAVNTLYDKDTAGSWNAMLDLLPLLNDGVHLVNHMGHCSTNYYMRFYNSNITDGAFTNDGMNHSFYITYSQGCYCGSFDNRSSGGGYGEDCINEKITVEIANGAVAAVANSRFGWGMHLGTNGASQYFDRQFFDALFGEGISKIGWTNQDSKEDNIPYVGYPLQRWCYYQLNLFGDPTLDIWTDQPAPMVASHPDAVPAASPCFEVLVEHVHGARVAISQDGNLLGRAFTDETGIAVVQFESVPEIGDTLDLWVTAHDKLPNHGLLYVALPLGPHLVCADHVFDDDQGGDSWGDDDGEVELGETVELSLTLTNVGTDTAFSVVATVSSAQPGIQFSQATREFGDVAPGAHAQSLGPYVFTAQGNYPDGTETTILVAATSGADTWESYVPMTLRAPSLSLEGIELSELSGNANGHADAGEIIALVPVVSNNAVGTLWNITGSLSTNDSGVTIFSSSSPFPDLLPDSSAGCENPFLVRLASALPPGHLASFTLALSGAGGYAATFDFAVPVGRKPLLLVDADNEGTEFRVVEVLADLGEIYDFWPWHEWGPPGLQELERYEVIIWAAGDQNLSTCHTEDRLDIGAYLDNGGALLFSAENYLSAYSDDPFTSEYLHVADWKLNVALFASVVGAPEDPIGAGLQVPISYPIDLAEAPDSIAPGERSAVVFRSSETLIPTVIRYPASGDSQYRVMFFATPLEAFSDTGNADNNIAGVLKRSLAWLRGADDCQAPTAPPGVEISSSGSLRWAASTDNVGVEAYRIYRSTRAHFMTTGLAPWATTMGTTLDVSSCIGDPSVNYYFRITAYDTAGNESWPSLTVGEHDINLGHAQE